MSSKSNSPRGGMNSPPGGLNSPRGGMNSPRSLSEHEKILSRDISLAVAAIIEESKTYKEDANLEPHRKSGESPRRYGYGYGYELRKKGSFDSTSSRPISDPHKLKKFKKKIPKKVKLAVPKIKSAAAADNKPEAAATATAAAAGRPVAAKHKSAPAPLQGTSKKVVVSSSVPKLSPSVPEMKSKIPKLIKQDHTANKGKAKTIAHDSRSKKKKSPLLSLKKTTASEAVNVPSVGSVPVQDPTETKDSIAVSKSELSVKERKGEEPGLSSKEQKTEEPRAETTQTTPKREKRFVPSPPNFKDYGPMEVVQYINSVQKYLDQLGYERTGEPKIRVNTKLSMKHLMGTARQLIKAGEQIKCLHALVMGIHFTNNCNTVERFPIHFRSLVNGKTYKHVILGIYMLGNYGALGISRDAGLQDKPPIYPRLSDMINDYFRHYTEAGHELKEVQIGNIISHNALSLEPITWKLAKIDMQTLRLTYETEIEKCSRKLRSQMGTACLKCTHMDPYEYIEQTATTKVLNKTQLGIPQVKSKSLSQTTMKSRSLVATKTSGILQPKRATLPPTTSKVSGMLQGRRTLPPKSTTQKPPNKPALNKPFI